MYLCLGFVQLVLGRFSADLGGFLAVPGGFSAYLQRVLGGFSFRLALDSIFEGSGGPEAARVVPGWHKRWPQGVQESFKNSKKQSLFYKAFWRVPKHPVLAPLWVQDSQKSGFMEPKRPPKTVEISLLFDKAFLDDLEGANPRVFPPTWAPF